MFLRVQEINFALVYLSSSLIYTFNIPFWVSLIFSHSVILPGVSQPNYTIEKKEIVTSHTPTNHSSTPPPPFHHFPPSLEARSEGLAEGSVVDYSDGNKGKLLLRGGENPGSHCKRIRDGGGCLTPLLQAVSLYGTPVEGAHQQDQQPCRCRH